MLAAKPSASQNGKCQYGSYWFAAGIPRQVTLIDRKRIWAEKNHYWVCRSETGIAECVRGHFAILTMVASFRG